MITRWLIAGLAGALSGGISWLLGVPYPWTLVIAGATGFLTGVTRDLWLIVIGED